MQLQKKRPMNIKTQFWPEWCFDTDPFEIDFDVRVVEEFPTSWLEKEKQLDLWVIAAKKGKAILAGFPVDGGSFHHQIIDTRATRHPEYGGITKLLIMDIHHKIWNCPSSRSASSVIFCLNMLIHDYSDNMLDFSVIGDAANMIETPEPLPVFTCSDDCGECIYDLEMYMLKAKAGDERNLRCYKTHKENRVTITRTK